MRIVKKTNGLEGAVAVDSRSEVGPNIQVLIPKAAFGGDFTIPRSLDLTIVIISTAYACLKDARISGANINKN